MAQTLDYGIGPVGGVVPKLVDAAGRTIVQGYKDNVLHGYSEVLCDIYDNLALPAGVTNFNWPAVPAGHVYHLTYHVVQYVGTVATVFYILSLTIAARAQVIFDTAFAYSTQTVTKAFDLYIPAGGFLSFSLGNATLNDDLHCTDYGNIFHVP